MCLAERKGLPETDRCVGIDLGVRKRPGRSGTCPSAACGLVADRDVNPAINILAAGALAAGASTWAVGPCVAPQSYARAA